MKHITLSVTNDLITDQRVARIAGTLSDAGARVSLLGVKRPDCKPVPELVYETKRFWTPFQKGPLFYAYINFRLFIYFLVTRIDVLVANDLDTLPANALAARIKRIPLVYDSHELFTEVPELQDRPTVQRMWERIENLFLPKVKYAYTVCHSIAMYYHAKYGIHMEVVRNVPLRMREEVFVNPVLNLPADKKIILYQGALNLGRGIEQVIDAMCYLDSCFFVIAGDGDVAQQLRDRVKEKELTERVLFTGKIPYKQLKGYTQSAHLGISLEENLGLNYYYSLPNKLFDYIQSQVPVLVSDFPESGAVVKRYNIGLTTNESDPEKLAALINSMFADEARYETWKVNLQKAADELCWENEERILLKVYERAGAF